MPTQLNNLIDRKFTMAIHPTFNLLTTEGADAEFTDSMLPGLEISDTEYTARSASFKNNTFISVVSFRNTNLGLGLLFQKCHFKERLSFENVVAHGVDPRFNPNSQSLSFIDCTFDNKVLFNCGQSEIDRSVYFSNCKFKEGLTINGLNVGPGSFTLDSCTIFKNLDLFWIKVEQQISLSDNKINCDIRIESALCDTISLSGQNTLTNDLFIRYCELTGGLIFNDGIFSGETQIYDMITKREGLVIIGSVFEKSVHVNHYFQKDESTKGFNVYYISNSSFNDGIYVVGQQHFLQAEPKVDKITLKVTAKMKGDISFSGFDVGKLDIEGYNSSANIIFKNLLVNYVAIGTFINNAALIFSTVKASLSNWFEESNPNRLRQSCLMITNSNLGKAQFYEVDFSSFITVQLHNTILTDISTSLVKWFTSQQLEELTLKVFTNNYTKVKRSGDKRLINEAKLHLIEQHLSFREIYRQLKFASQKQADMAQAMEFQRCEMDHYRKITELKRPRNWSEHLILFTSQTNDFGQSWIKAVGFALVFTFLSYIPVAFLSSSELDYSHFAKSWHDVWVNIRVVFWDNLKSWSILLNPAHRLKDINENIDHFPSIIYLFDFLSRIVVSYFIFQIVSAFRKFNK